MLAVISSDLWVGVSCSHPNEVSSGLSTARLGSDLLRPWQCGWAGVCLPGAQHCHCLWCRADYQQ